MILSNTKSEVLKMKQDIKNFNELEFNKQLKLMRSIINLSQRELSEEFNIKFRTYQDYEYGKSEPQEFVKNSIIENIVNNYFYKTIVYDFNCDYGIQFPKYDLIGFRGDAKEILIPKNISIFSNEVDYFFSYNDEPYEFRHLANYPTIVNVFGSNKDDIRERKMILNKNLDSFYGLICFIKNKYNFDIGLIKKHLVESEYENEHILIKKGKKLYSAPFYNHNLEGLTSKEKYLVYEYNVVINDIKIKFYSYVIEKDNYVIGYSL